jgi:hypothetical protein
MTFNLLTQINESAKIEQKHVDLVTDAVKNTFGDQAAATIVECETAWDNGKDISDNESLQEARMTAAQGRSTESDWLQTMKDDEQKKDNKLGINQTAIPKNGDAVILQGGIGQVVEVDPKSKQVIIKNKAGQEKGFNFADLAGPREVQGKKAWALKELPPAWKSAR